VLVEQDVVILVNGEVLDGRGDVRIVYGGWVGCGGVWRGVRVTRGNWAEVKAGGKICAFGGGGTLGGVVCCVKWDCYLSDKV